MKNKIIKLLEKYEDEIMKNTLGDFIDEYDERYAEVYKWEWKEHKSSIAFVLDKFISSKNKIDAIGFAYVIVCEWSGVMTFDDGDLNIIELEEICKKILNELE
jgi:hypothetical protein